MHGKLNGNIVISKSGFLDFIQAVVLAHIIEIACKNGVLRMANKDAFDNRQNGQTR